MSKKAKITVYCPHCAAEQHEPAIARSTYCRTCSDYFTISPAVMVRPKAAAQPGPLPARGPRLVTPSLPPTSSPVPGAASLPPSPTLPGGDEAAATPTDPEPAPFAPPAFPRPSAHEPAAAAATSAAAGSVNQFRDRIGSLFGAAPKSQMVRCFECNGAQEVSGASHSTICRDCGAYVDLQDYKISGSFSRNIVTRGTVTLAKGGDLSSSKVVCSGAIIHGRLRGNLLCSGRVTLRSRGRMPGTLEAGLLIIEKGSEIEFNRPVRVTGLDVSGIISGPLFECDGHVTVHRMGILRGSVRAKGFFVEKDGGFEGELTIRPRQAVALAAAAGDAAVNGNNEAQNAAEESLPPEPRHLWVPSPGLIGQEPSPG